MIALTAEPGPWIALFNGQSLDGWHDSKGRPVTKGWTVTDGTLHRAAKGPSIFSKRHFSSFELIFEWRLAPRTNSGVKYRFAGGVGPEYQLLDDPKEQAAAYHRTAALYEVKAASGAPIEPPGSWNRSRIVAHGDRLEHWLNGEQVMTIQVGTPEWNEAIARSKFKDRTNFGRSPGPIMIQDHGGEVWFREIRIRELDTGGVQ